MMFENDPEAIQASVTYRQERIREDARSSRTPRTSSRLRVAIGVALIHAGERIRGYAQSTPADSLPSIPASQMGPVRHA